MAPHLGAPHGRRQELLVHGGKGQSVEALQGLQPGISVVVHYSIVGGDAAAQEVDQIGNGGLSVAEGMATHIDRRGKHITIRFDDGHSDTFVAHFFKQAS
jgi:hypothetical protein